jgi:rare lipoprotein A
MAKGFKVLGWVAAAGLTLTACATVRPPPSPHAEGTMRPYEVNGVWYRPRAQPDYDRIGLASWYGHESPHRTTADGEIYDTGAVTGAHTTLPLPCIVEVTNLENGRRLRVRLNDRGPFSGGRIIDVSPEAARELGFYGHGVARVRVRYVGPAPGIATRLAGPPAAPSPAPPPAPSGPAPIEVAAAVVIPTGPARPCRIQAGAFADLGNARREAARQSARGGASIETTDRRGAPLYRVMVDCAAS